MLVVVRANQGGRAHTQEREDVLQAHPGQSPNVSLSYLLRPYPPPGLRAEALQFGGWLAPTPAKNAPLCKRKPMEESKKMQQEA